MRHQQAADLFWLAFSILVIWGALGLGLGSLSTPGMGFMSFGAAALLAMFSVARLIRSSKGDDREGAAGKALFRGTLWWRVVSVLAALFGYLLILPRLGYLISTFLLMSLLLWIAGGRKVWRIILYALCMAVVTYYVFSKWLNCQFPEGFLGF